MRHIKSDVISILGFTLLLGSTVTVVAQDEVEAPGADAASLVAGEVFWTAASAFEEETQSDGIVHQRSRELTGTTDMSDARLSGELTMHYDSDVFIAGDFADILWGTVRILNGEGAWDGWLVGTSDTTTRSGEGSTYFELLGSGAHLGLSAVLFLPERVDPETGEATYPLNGVIFPGRLPSERTFAASPVSPRATPAPTPSPATPTPSPATPTPTPDIYGDL